MPVEYPFLFNFAASYSQGGYKRLHEYARWFDRHGGAWFAIHPRCEHLRSLFPGNSYFTIARSHVRRLLDDFSYLDDIGRIIGQPELYYAYGIPLYRRFGRMNWFHLQNVLTVGTHAVPLSMPLRLKLRLLGGRFQRGFSFADVVSAESRYSLQMLQIPAAGRKMLSANGNDDELAQLDETARPLPDDVATAVGTISYKALGDSFAIFRSLRERIPGLQLVIIGEPKHVPGWLRRRSEVIVRGTLQRQAVIETLRHSRFYLSATHVENSYNAAAEGAFLAAESFISDIPPHRELLLGENFDTVRFAGLSRPFLHLQKQRLKGVNLQSWHAIITEMIATVRRRSGETAQVIPLRPDITQEPASPADRPRQRSLK
jgi:glycosyltransferase involved in cell wall biosynthesis